MKKINNKLLKIFVCIVILLSQNKYIFMGNVFSSKKKNSAYRSIKDKKRKIGLKEELYDVIISLYKKKNESIFRNRNFEFKNEIKLALKGLVSSKRSIRFSSLSVFQYLFDFGVGFDEALEAISSEYNNKKSKIRYSVFDLLRRLIKHIPIFENDFKQAFLIECLEKISIGVYDKNDDVRFAAIRAFDKLLFHIDAIGYELLDELFIESIRISCDKIQDKCNMVRYYSLNILYQLIVNLEFFKDFQKNELFEISERCAIESVLDKDRYVRIRSIAIIDKLVFLKRPSYGIKRSVRVGMKDKDSDVKKLFIALNDIIFSYDTSLDFTVSSAESFDFI